MAFIRPTRNKSTAFNDVAASNLLNCNDAYSFEQRLMDLPLGELSVTLESENRTLWCMMKPQPRPCFTPKLLRDIALLQNLLITEAAPPVDYLVLGSSIAGVFNLGGDLKLFVDTIRRNDRIALQNYARACVAVGYTNYLGYHHQMTTIALLEGDALGGGFECALSFDILIAERQVKFSLPEVLFNLFPGMGAYSFLSRRVGVRQAEAIIGSGATYSAADMHKLGILDAVVEPGGGRAQIAALIARQRNRQQIRRALHQIQRRVTPVSLTELNDITDLWVDNAMALAETDLRKMGRIALAQDRQRARLMSLEVDVRKVDAIICAA